MNLQTTKAKLVAKLLRAKYFVLVTEKEAFMHLSGLNPRKTRDLITIAEQQASLETFKDQLTQVIDEHEQRAAELGKKKKGGTRVKANRK